MSSPPDNFFSFTACSWNVRGLNDAVKCVDVSADILSARPTILALQETKLGHTSPQKASSFLPSSLRSFQAVDAIGTSGGLISAWDRNIFSLALSSPSRHVLSLDLTFTYDGTSLRFSNVYAPCDRFEKAAFLIELASHEPNDDTPWLISGDFNLTREPSDRNNDNFSLADAGLFKDSINNLALIELPLPDRLYTWSNGREVPTLIRLDRMFINHAWNARFPSSCLASLARDTSDHVPLIATISTSIPRRGFFPL
jgi:endonuclease/exonuclease/phosphatase family metal-dependent hydrolase